MYNLCAPWKPFSGPERRLSPCFRYPSLRRCFENAKTTKYYAN